MFFVFEKTHLWNLSRIKHIVFHQKQLFFDELRQHGYYSENLQNKCYSERGTTFLYDLFSSCSWAFEICQGSTIQFFIKNWCFLKSYGNIAITVRIYNKNVPTYTKSHQTRTDFWYVYGSLKFYSQHFMKVFEWVQLQN